MQTGTGVMNDSNQDTIVYPFKSLGHAYSYFNECNPARARSLNLLEPESGHKPTFPDFSGQSPKDLWAGVLYCIREGLRGKDSEHRRVWALRNLGPRTHQLSAQDIAVQIGRHPSWVYTALKQINKRIEQELVDRSYIPERS